MTDELVLYTNPMSRGRIARWMLEEVGAPYRRDILNYNTSMKSDDYRRLNLMGKVPAIVHGTRVVTECAAICAYLADAFPQAGLAPATDDRADYYRWLFFAAGPVEACVSNRALGFQVPDDKKATIGYGSYGDVVETLEKAVTGREFVAGDRFTAADVYVGAHISWGLQFGTLEKRPAFEDYAGRMMSREAARRAKALDDADMAAVKR